MQGRTGEMSYRLEQKLCSAGVLDWVHRCLRLFHLKKQLSQEAEVALRTFPMSYSKIQRKDINKRQIQAGRDQEYTSTYLACMRPWVQFPTSLASFNLKPNIYRIQFFFFWLYLEIVYLIQGFSEGPIPRLLGRQALGPIEVRTWSIGLYWSCCLRTNNSSHTTFLIC